MLSKVPIFVRYINIVCTSESEGHSRKKAFSIYCSLMYTEMTFLFNLAILFVTYSNHIPVAALAVPIWASPSAARLVVYTITRYSWPNGKLTFFFCLLLPCRSIFTRYVSALPPNLSTSIASTNQPVLVSESEVVQT